MCVIGLITEPPATGQICMSVTAETVVDVGDKMGSRHSICFGINGDCGERPGNDSFFRGAASQGA